MTIYWYVLCLNKTVLNKRCPNWQFDIIRGTTQLLFNTLIDYGHLSWWTGSYLFCIMGCGLFCVKPWLKWMLAYYQSNIWKKASDVLSEILISIQFQNILEKMSPVLVISNPGLRAFVGVNRWQYNCRVRSLPISIYPDAATTVTRQDSPYTSHLPFVLITEAFFSGIHLSIPEKKRIVGILTTYYIATYYRAVMHFMENQTTHQTQSR